MLFYPVIQAEDVLVEFFGPVPTDTEQHLIYVIVLRQTLGYIIDVDLDNYVSSDCSTRHRCIARYFSHDYGQLVNLQQM